ncbi:MAG: pyridoxal phosphate-dependent aminotransferase [Phycisphaerales bacterium]|jgi:aspartate aminotransferase
MHIGAAVSAMKESATLAVSAKAASLKAAGKPVIAFGVGEPDFDTPDLIRQAAQRGLDAGLTRYAPTPGDRAARMAIARKLQRENGIACEPEHVTITVGAKHAIAMALQTMLDPGDEVVLPGPAWVSYRPLIELHGGVCREVPSDVEDGFRLSPAAIERAITPRTRAVLLNSPSNPCGVAQHPGIMGQVFDMLAAHPDVMVLSDEIYEKLVYPEVDPHAVHRSPGADPRLADRTITVNGMSKAYAMTGWRVGYLAAPGDGGRFARELIKLQGQLTNAIPSFIMPAIVAALEHGAAGVETMRRAFAARAVLTHRLLTEIPRFRTTASNAAFYAFPCIRPCMGLRTPAGRVIESAQAFAEALLEEALVAVVPGEDFGACAATNIRISFACSESTITEGIGRIAAFTASLR